MHEYDRPKPSAEQNFLWGMHGHYTAVGMELSAMYGAIWAAEANATSMFQAHGGS